MHSPHDFSAILEACFRGVWQASWQGALAIGLVLLTRWAFGTRVPARWHYLLWFLVLARLLVPSGALPHTRTSWQNLWRVTHTSGRTAGPVSPPTVQRMDAETRVPAQPTRGPVFREAGPRMRPMAARADRRRSWWAWAAWVWLGGVGLFGGWLVACHGNLRRRLRRETWPVQAEVLDRWEACCRRWLRRETPRLLAADWVSSPALVGWWRPTLLVPREALGGFSEEDWEHVFAHEIAHLRWRDHWSQGFMLAAWCVHWFNPAVWIGFRRLRADRELAADEWVLKHLAGERALAYGETLFKTVAKRPADRSFRPGLVGISEDGAQMKQRLQRIATFLPQRRVMGSLAGLGIVLLLASVVLGQSASEPAASPAGKAAAKAAAVVTVASKVEAKPAAGAEKTVEEQQAAFAGEMLAAARAGRVDKIQELFKTAAASPNPPKFSEDVATQLLNTLVQQRELAAFTVLVDPLKQTGYGKDWKPSDKLLSSLVEDGRTDFLDALLARRLDLKRLSGLSGKADDKTGEWIGHRVAEVGKQQADVEAFVAAAGVGDLPTLQRLVAEGVNVNSVGKEDDTPLVRAALKNQLEAARFLLDQGAQVDKPRLPGWNYTPLCLVNSVAMAELLKAHGADMHAKLYGRDVSILTYVAMWAPADVVAWFLKQGLDAKMLGDNQENLLFGLKDARTAEVLLKLGVDPNQVDKQERTPLCDARSAAVVQALVKHGADLHYKLPDGETLVEAAVSGIIDDEPGSLAELIEEGADFDPKGNGAGALMTAAFHNEVARVKVLLDHGVNPNASVDGPFHTGSALSNAAGSGSSEALNLLLARGADPSAIPPKDRETPLANALIFGSFKNAEILRQAGAKGVSDLSYYSALGNARKVEELLGQGADPNQADSAGQTALYYAVRRLEPEVTRILLEHGASVDRFDVRGESPYVEFRFFESVLKFNPKNARWQWDLSEDQAQARLAAVGTLLAEHPPTREYRDAEGRTALEQVAWAGNSLVAGYLLDDTKLHADPNAPDHEGRPPLLLAALSPAAKNTTTGLTVNVGTPQEKKWNNSAYLADQLIRKGAKLDLVLSGGKTVRELAKGAAYAAGNTQLLEVLSEDAAAGSGQDNDKAGPGGGTPTPGPQEKTDEKKSGQDKAPAASPAATPAAEAELPPALPQNLAELSPAMHDVVWGLSWEAIKHGNIQIIQALLDRGLDPNADLESSSSLLFNAVDDNQLGIVKLLLAHGANLLAKTSWGDVPLQRACWRGYKDIADALIQAGAPVNELWYDTGMGDLPALAARDRRQPITDTQARDNLFFAVASGHPEAFEFLWKKLAPRPDADKEKLLGDLYENVGKWGQPSLLPVLETLGASPAKDGSRALALAAGWNYVDTVKALLERGVSPNFTPPRRYTLLRDAAGSGRNEVVRLLLEHGADPNARDPQGFTPLAWAAYSGEEEACLTLLDHGADGSSADDDGRNAAWHAAGGPHCPEALAQMIRAGVKMTGQDKEGHGILINIMHFATPRSMDGAFFMKVYSPADLDRFDERERRVIDLLADAGVDLNGPVGGPVPLIEAMQSQHYVAAQELLKRGADPARTDKDGTTPLYELFNFTLRDRPLPLELIKTLVEHGGSGSSEVGVPHGTPPSKTSALEAVIGTAAEDETGGHSYQDAVKIMLDAGGKFPGVADANVQALLQGAAHGDLAAMQASIGKGAPVSAADGDGWDALAITTALGYGDCAGWLLDHGADVSGKNRAEWYWATPLSFAVLRNQAELVDKLLAHGAKAAGNSGVLSEAVGNKNQRIFDALLRAGANPNEEVHFTMSTGGKTFRPADSFALFLCIRDGLTGMATALLDHGAEADPANLQDNRNLAYWAVHYDRPQILRALLDHGANPSVPDDKGEMPLDLARKSHPELVGMLEATNKRREAAGK